MDTIFEHCAGLDVHKQSVVACVRHLRAKRVKHEIRTFGTTTRDLLALGDWLASEQVTHVAMESTGVYWKPVHHLIEDQFEVLVVNARHIKQVPGRKSDIQDCQWIAQLLQHGLLRASFVPKRAQRELRDLTRQRWQLQREKSRAANRIQKVLEDANIKLGSVASDVLGVSGREMIEALIAGETDARAMAELARHRLRKKIPQLCEALHGKVTAHHRFMLRSLMDHVRYLESMIEQFDARIEQAMNPLEHRAVELLDTMPGVDRRTAENVIAEIGVDMDQFPSAQHLASWAGLCPTMHQSAGKRRRGKIAEGNRWLKATLTQSAWAASRTKGTYVQSLYRRLAGRRGKKRAAIAVAHYLLTIAYHMVADHSPYREPGPNHLHHQQREHTTKKLVKKLTALGYNVELKPAA